MKYIVCEKPEHFELKEKKEPELRNPSLALLKIKRVGICGTDLHAYHGNQAFFKYPRILGHELAAEVLAIQEGNPQGLKEGDLVVIMPYVNCEKCSACLDGKPNCCQNIKVFGVHTDGGMQERILFPNRLLLKANHLSLENIAIVEPLAIGAHAIRRSGIKQEQTAVVIGCGPIGIGIIQLCKYLGVKVIALDINEHRLRVVKENFKADYVVNALNEPLKEIKKITNNLLANTVFEASGNKSAIEGGFDFMRHGGNFVLVGLFKGALSFEHPSIHSKETTLLCSRNATKEDFEFVMKVLEEKAFNTDFYITSKVPFENILIDFEKWASPTSQDIKVVTTLS